LDGFETYEVVKGTPSMTVTRNGIAFNQAAVLRLQSAPRVHLLLDREGRRFAIAACDEDEPGTLPFHREGSPTSKGVRWNNTDLRLTLGDVAQVDTERQGFKAAGVFHSSPSPALEFDLKNLSPLPERGKNDQ